ncbi:cyclase [Fodinicola acaciae]|uniref:cyclase n=1 Tax=Fodinicola acaciae TaxID=2681555 RepID=UPI0013D4C0C9|nr:cyclase [Fodinicola acaciae]
MNRLALVAAVAVVVASDCSAYAAAAVVFHCRATAGHQSATFALNQAITATAPPTAHPGAPVELVLDPSPNRIPASVGGRQVREVTNMVLSIPLPANSSYRTARLTGPGAGLHSTPTAGIGGRTIVVKVPGPLRGGGVFELPVLTISLIAGSAGQIVGRLGGVSYDRPGLTATATVRGPFGIAVRAATQCFPSPNPILTTTTIG